MMSEPLVLAEDYPYVKKQEKCKKPLRHKGVSIIDDWVFTKNNDINQLKAAIKVGPTAIHISSTNFVF